MPKTLEEYVEEFAHHLRKKGKSECTIHNYTLAIKQLLCNIVDDRDKKATYNLIYTPNTLKYTYLEDFCYRVKQAYEPHTQRSKLAGLKRYLRYIKARHNNTLFDDYEKEKELYQGKDEDILRAEPDQDVYEEPLTHKEVQQFFEISKFDLRNNAILKMLYYTGARVHSLINLNVNDIDFTPRTDENGIEYHNVTIRYLKGKWKKPIVIAVHPEAIESIKKYLEIREEPKEGYKLDSYREKLYHKDAVFLNSWGNRISYLGIFMMMKRYAVRLRIDKNVHPHLWRTTTITMMDNAGMTEGQIKRVSGHSKLSDALKGYINPNMSDVLSGYNKALNLNKPEEKQMSLQKPIDNQEKPILQPQQPQQQPQVDINKMIDIIQQQQQEIENLKKQKDVGYQ